MAHTCPIGGGLINEPTVRVVAAQVAVIATIGAYFQDPFIFIFLAFDFFVRGFNKKEWSVLRYVGIKTVTFIDIKEKLIDAGGKDFASKVGFIISTIIAVAGLFQVNYLVLGLSGILILFATLEAMLAYCVGCKVYTFYTRVVDSVKT